MVTGLLFQFLVPMSLASVTLFYFNFFSAFVNLTKCMRPTLDSSTTTTAQQMEVFLCLNRGFYVVWVEPKLVRKAGNNAVVRCGVARRS